MNGKLEKTARKKGNKVLPNPHYPHSIGQKGVVGKARGHCGQRLNPCSMFAPCFANTNLRKHFPHTKYAERRESNPAKRSVECALQEG